jgi:hypothetical protein
LKLGFFFGVGNKFRSGDPDQIVNQTMLEQLLIESRDITSIICWHTSPFLLSLVPLHLLQFHNPS